MYHTSARSILILIPLSTASSINGIGKYTVVSTLAKILQFSKPMKKKLCRSRILDFSWSMRYNSSDNPQ
jgi:hypothetical protein